MASMLQATLVAAAGTGEHTELPVSPLTIGIGALVLFIVLLAITWSFRNTSHKH